MSALLGGGPAFPFTYVDKSTIEIYTGMTLRDYFAGQAMGSFAHSGSVEAAAQYAYHYADAMLKAREVEP